MKIRSVSEINLRLHLKKQRGRKLRGRRRKLCSEERYDMYWSLNVNPGGRAVLSRRSASSCLRGLWFRIPPATYMSVVNVGCC